MILMKRIQISSTETRKEKPSQKTDWTDEVGTGGGAVHSPTYRKRLLPAEEEEREQGPGGWIAGI